MYAQDRVDTFLNEVHQRHPRVAGDAIERVYDSISHNYTRDTWSAHKRWSKIERRALVAVLNELVVQVAAGWRDPDVRNASYAARFVQDARYVVVAAQEHPVTYALGVFDSRRDGCVNSLRHIQLEDTKGHRQHACNAARAALCLPRDPLVLWDYMLEQLWLSAHDKTGGEAGMAQRLHDALITIFEEER